MTGTTTADNGYPDKEIWTRKPVTEATLDGRREWTATRERRTEGLNTAEWELDLADILHAQGQ